MRSTVALSPLCVIACNKSRYNRVSSTREECVRWGEGRLLPYAGRSRSRCNKRLRGARNGRNILLFFTFGEIKSRACIERNDFRLIFAFPFRVKSLTRKQTTVRPKGSRRETQQRRVDSHWRRSVRSGMECARERDVCMNHNSPLLEKWYACAVWRYACVTLVFVSSGTETRLVSHQQPNSTIRIESDVKQFDRCFVLLHNSTFFIFTFTFYVSHSFFCCYSLLLLPLSPILLLSSVKTKKGKKQNRKEKASSKIIQEKGYIKHRNSRQRFTIIYN